MEIKLILVVSLALHGAAAFLALKLTRMTGPRRAWLLVSAALLLMTVRRSISLYEALNGQRGSLSAEGVALLTSLVMLAGMASMAPLLRSIEQSRAVLRRSHTELEALVEARTAELAQINADLRLSETRLARLNECFLGFGPDPAANISLLTHLCGELLGATCALYNRLDEGLLCTIAQWQAPPGYTPVDAPEGHLCYDVIQAGEPLIVHDLQHSPYADSDPNVRSYGLDTYIGQPVRVGTRTIGSLCVVYQRPFSLGEAERKLLEILATALGIEEARQQIAEALRASEERMRLVVQNLPVMVDAVDDTHTIIMWNRECERVTGYSADEMVGNPRAFEILFPDPAVRRDLEGAGYNGAFRDLEIPLACKDGSQRIIARSDVSKLHPIPGWASWSVGIDVTERKQTEQALRQVQEQLEQRVTQRTLELHQTNAQLTREIAERRRAEAAEREQRMLAEALRDTAVVLNKTLDLDEVLKRLLGNIERVVPHDAADIMVIEGQGARVAYYQGPKAGQTVLNRTFEIDRFPHLRRMMETGLAQLVPDVNQYAEWLRLPETAWIRAHLSVPILLEGEIIGLLNVNSATPNAFTTADADRLQACAAQAAAAIRNARLYTQARQEIAERQRAEEKLAAQEAFLRQIIHTTPSLIFTKDRTGRHTLVNERFAEFFGTTVENLIGKTDLEILPDRATAEKYVGQDRRVFETGEALAFQPTLLTNRSTGEQRWYQSVKVPVIAPDGTITHVLGVMTDITTQKEIEAALRESEQRFRSLFESAAVGIAITAPGGPLLEANPALCTMLGYTLAELRALNYADFTHPDDLPAERALVAELIGGQRDHYRIEKRYVCKDGSIIWVRLTASSVRDADGHILYGLGIVEDITARKQAEEALEAQRAFLRQIIDTNPSLIFVKDSQGRYVLVNQAMARSHNTTVDRMIGKTDAEINPFKDEVAHYVQQDQLVIASRRVLFVAEEIATNRHTGETRWYQGVKVPLFLPGSQECHVLGVSTDISARKEAEDRLRQSEAALAAVIHAIPDAIVCLDRQGTCVRVYANHVDPLALPENDLIGKPFDAALPPDSAAEARRCLEEALQTEEVQVLEYRLPPGPRDFEARFTSSGPDEVLVIIRDVTTAKQARQRELLFLLEKERSRILNEFIRDAAQEFGTPLSVIKTSLYLLERLENQEKRASSMRMLNKQTAYIEKLVDGMLTMTRLDNEDCFTFDRVVINAVLDTVKDQFMPLAEQGGVVFHVDAEPDLPPVHADQRYLHRALANLVDNAILYNRPGGTITVRARRQGDQVAVEVRDSGIGIAENHMGQLFTRFFRADPAREKRGAGLGLSIARKIIEQHAGRITVTSVLGEGSVFEVWLPVGGDTIGTAP